jgi:hypothetical protein
MDGGLGAGELGCVVAASGCHAKGTPILLHNGRTKLVEDVVVGDALMGPDNFPRYVQRLARGNETMYRISPTKGVAFEVNAGHILSLVRITKNGRGNIVNISVEEYLKKSQSFKNTHKLYKTTELEFSSEYPELPLHPHFLGLLLGDGSLKAKNLSITTMDTVLVDKIQEYSAMYGCHNKKFTKLNNLASTYSISHRSGVANPVAEYLKSLEVFNLNSVDKFIPDVYKYSSVENRLQLLAGLIDADGHLHHKGFDIVLGSERMLDDIIFIARSVGLAANKKFKIVNGTTYYRTAISGHTDKIPCILSRKQSGPRNQIKNVLHFGFTIEQLEVSDVNDITDGGLGAGELGCIVASSGGGKSWALCALGSHAMKLGKRVVHYTFELQQNYVGLRYDTVFTGIEPNKIRENIQRVQESVDSVTGSLVVKYFPPRSVSMNAIAAHIERMVSVGKGPDIIILDYADLMQCAGKADSRHEQLQLVHEEFRGLLGRLQIPGWTASQAQRSSIQDDVIEADKIAGSYGKIMTDDLVISISRKVSDKVNNTARAYVIKNRFGSDGQTFPAIMDLAHGKIEFYDETDEEYQSVKNKMHDGENSAREVLKDKHKLFLEKRKDDSDPILPSEN